MAIAENIATAAEKFVLEVLDHEPKDFAEFCLLVEKVARQKYGVRSWEKWLNLFGLNSTLTLKRVWSEDGRGTV
jgi:hypothetical protein